MGDGLEPAICRLSCYTLKRSVGPTILALQNPKRLTTLKNPISSVMLEHTVESMAGCVMGLANLLGNLLGSQRLLTTTQNLENQILSSGTTINLLYY